MGLLAVLLRGRARGSAVGLAVLGRGRGGAMGRRRARGRPQRRLAPRKVALLHDVEARGNLSIAAFLLLSSLTLLTAASQAFPRQGQARSAAP